MLKPNGSTVEMTGGGAILWVHVATLDCSLLGNGFLVPAAGYTVASYQAIDKTTTSLSTGVLEACVANDPQGDIVVSRPTAVEKSAAGATDGYAVQHGYAGVRVKTAQASVVMEVWMVLRT